MISYYKFERFALRLVLVVYILITIVALFSFSPSATNSQKHSISSKSISGTVTFLISEEKEKENEGDDHEAFISFLPFEIQNIDQAISTWSIPTDYFDRQLRTSEIYLRHCSLQI